MFEMEERLNISINVFSYYDDLGKARYPLYVSRKTCGREIDLFYWEYKNMFHYAPINDLSRLFADLDRHKGYKFFCKRCLCNFQLETAFKSHQKVCSRENFISAMHHLPPPGEKIEFKNQKFQTWSPFIIYIDLESILVPEERRTKSTEIFENQKACAASALVCSTIRAFDRRECMFIGADCISELLNWLIRQEIEMIEFLKTKRRLPLKKGSKWEKEFNAATICSICKREDRPFDDSNEYCKVADHDHVTGWFRGAAHNRCNLNRRVLYDIPMYIHNFRGYDSHLIVTSMSEHGDRILAPIG